MNKKNIYNNIIFFRISHSWGHVFAETITLSYTTEAKLDGLGTSYTYSVAAMSQNSRELTNSTSQTTKYRVTCKAEPMTSNNCTMKMYEGYFEVGYTIHWTNYPATRGSYTAKGPILESVFY